MSNTVITVDKLSKAYHIGLKAERFPTFRDALISAAKSPFRRLGALAGGATTLGSKTFWALRDVSFEVQRGDVVGIIGRNGAGKSTLLKILSRITEPTAGIARLRGRVASLLEVGTGFHAELTGRENIYLNGAILGMKRAEIARVFDQIVAFAEVEQFLDTPVKFYSSGMYVRLAFAVAAHLEPEILIVDEVLAVGDADFQKKCLGKMREVSKGRGRTVLFVSHNMGAVRSLCNAAVLLSGGRLSHSGDVMAVVKEYESSRLKGSDHADGQCGDFTIREFRFISRENGPPRTFSESIIELHLLPHRDCGDIGAHVLIEDEQGTLIAGLDSRACGLNQRGIAGQPVTIRFTIKDLPLLPGDYHVRLVIRNDRTFKACEAHHVYPIKVVGDAIYGTTSLQRHLHGLVAMRVSNEA